MNSHFSRPYRGEGFTRRAYGRLDHYEPATDGSNSILLSFELVDADWFDRRFRRYYSPGPIPPLRDAIASWKNWFQLEIRNRTNPFDGAPLFQLEVVVQTPKSVFGGPELPLPSHPHFAATVEGFSEVWLMLAIAPAAGASAVGERADLYAGFFAEPMRVAVTGQPLHGDMKSIMTAVFNLDQFPAIDTADVEVLLQDAPTDYLGVYDVGQGNCNALLDADQFPGLYYDLGAGVYRNKHTTPPNLAFCFSRQPIVLLSHWDSDHWAGAYLTKVNSSTHGANYLPALHCNWIAPRQQIGPVQFTLACDIAAAGQLWIYDPVYQSPPGQAQTNSGLQLQFCCGDGTGRNPSGIVLAVSNPNSQDGHWLLTGDCDYRYFQSRIVLAAAVAVVVPHHGAKPDPASTPPAPAAAGRYARLVYSFGAGNVHGSSRHPTVECVAAHEKRGWLHAPAYHTAPGHAMPPGPDIRSTNCHAGTTRAGVLVGWDSPPAPIAPHCAGAKCTVMPLVT